MVPLTALTWAQFLPPREIEQRVKHQGRIEAPPSLSSSPPPPPNTVRRYTVCGIAGAENCFR
jgi:hypothetical protein